MSTYLGYSYAWAMEHQDEKAFLNSVAKRLADLRREKGLTQERLADTAGVDRVAIANIETGLRRPTVTTMYRLAKALGIKVEELFNNL
ncbi:helix-turn-helix transcriptional regulator [Candidatus Saccharibacteria bacterium]|nr:helix-turn-helix transcriptional regulator [Candidatus Saccharibacteria bacterium]